MEVVDALGTTACNPESGYDLVGNQKRAVRARDIAQRRHETVFRRYDAHVAGNRFDDHRRDLPASLGKRILEGRWVVVREDNRRGRGGWPTWSPRCHY